MSTETATPVGPEERVRNWCAKQTKEKGLVDLKFFPTLSLEVLQRTAVQDVASIIDDIEAGNCTELKAGDL